MKEDTPILEITNLHTGYGSTEILHGMDLHVHSGEVLAVVGRNGMGKTTLLKAIMGILPTHYGSIRLADSEISGEPPYRISRRSISYIPQENALFYSLTVQENIQLALRGVPGTKTALSSAFDLFPILKERLAQQVGTLSGGEQKMLLALCALLPQPRLILCDEISEGLQPRIIRVVRDALDRERQTRDLSLLLIEQNVQFALSLADRYAIMEGGQIVSEGTTNDPEARQMIEQRLTL